MLMKDKDSNDDGLEFTDEDNLEEVEIAEVEEESNDKIKSLREKLKVCESEKREHLEDLQRAKADFLNSRKRLEEIQAEQKDRLLAEHLENLFPLCDSFSMAMSDKAAWEAIDSNWRVGVEGIYSQLQSILKLYQVTAFDPIGEAFDPEQHEAVSNVKVETAEQNGKVVSVIQLGYKRTVDGREMVLRPARVTVGEFNKEN